MKTHTIQSLVAGLLVLLAQSQLMAFTPFTKEVNLANVTLPYKLEVELLAKGHVSFEVKKFPDKLTFFAQFPKGEGHRVNGTSGQARLSAGKHEITIMERHNRKAVGPLHLVITVSPEIDASEPNEDIKKAKPVQLGEHTVTLFPTGDVDCWVVDLPDRGYLSITSDKLPANTLVAAEVIDPFGKSLGSNFVHIRVPGKHTIKLTERYGRFTGRTPLNVKLELTPEEDHAEPNNLIADAASIPFGVWQQALAAPVGDKDFHELNVTVEGRIVMTAKDLDKGIVLASSIYDAEGKQLQLGYPYRVKPGKYYVCVEARYHKASLKPYTLKFDLMPIQRITPVEAKESTVIEPGLFYWSRLPGVHDVDRLAVAVKKLSIVTVRAELPKGANYQFGHKNKNGVERGGNPLWARGADSNIEFTLYSRYNHVTHTPLKVWAEVEEEFDPTEPNDLLTDAATLEVDKPRTCFLYPAGDTDWFKVEVKEPGEYYFHLAHGTDTATSPPRYIEVFRHDEQGKALGRLGLEGRSYGWATVPLKIEKAGTVILSVRSNDGSRKSMTVGLNQKKDIVLPVVEDSSGLDVFVAGVELDKNTAGRMEKMVKDGGGSFVNAEKAEEISDKLIEISEEIEKRSAPVATEAKKSGKSWLWLLLLLVPVGVWIVLRNKKAADDSTQD